VRCLPSSGLSVVNAEYILLDAVDNTLGAVDEYCASTPAI
jgi:hypothetical protein